MKNILARLSRNWKSGLTVSLVSLPLSISLAIAANATPLMGVITAFWAGIIAAIFGGSHFNVVGPTGALSGILATYAILYGVGVLSLLAVVSGVIILLFFAFRLDKYIAFIPSSVIQGFTLGVAFIIGLNQLNFALGLSGLPQHAHFFENVVESLKHIGQTNFYAFGLFALSLTLLFVFLKYIKSVPSPIIVAAIGIVLGLLSAKGILPFSLQTLFTRYGELKISLLSFPHISPSMVNADIVKASFAIALIAILETLISAKIADQLTKTKFQQRREVFGLGLANIISGLTGGIPATAALARTALNIKSGADDKSSAVINSVAVAVIALIFFSTFQYLPLAVVAAILVYVAIRMVEQEHFVHLYHYDKVAFGLSIVVALLTIVEDPIIGILVGATISLLFFVNKLSKAKAEVIFNQNGKITSRLSSYKLREHDSPKGDLVVYRFIGQFTYVNAESHLETIKKVEEKAKTVVLNFRNLFYIDVDGLNTLHQIVEELQIHGKEVVISSVSSEMKPILEELAWYRELKTNKKVFARTSDVLKTFGFKLETV